MRNKFIIASAVSAFALSIIGLRNKLFLDAFRKEVEKMSKPEEPVTPAQTVPADDQPAGTDLSDS